MQGLRQSVDFILRTKQADRATPLLLPVHHYAQIRIGQVPEQKRPRFRAGGFHGQVADINGNFQIEAQPGSGTWIRLTVPFT